jgi:hypothetical protein
MIPQSKKDSEHHDLYSNIKGKTHELVPPRENIIADDPLYKFKRYTQLSGPYDYFLRYSKNIAEY